MNRLIFPDGNARRMASEKALQMILFFWWTLAVLANTGQLPSVGQLFPVGLLAVRKRGSRSGGGIVQSRSIKMGRWSEDSGTSAFQLAAMEVSAEHREMSGDLVEHDEAIVLDFRLKC